MKLWLRTSWPLILILTMSFAMGVLWPTADSQAFIGEPTTVPSPGYANYTLRAFYQTLFLGAFVKYVLPLLILAVALGVAYAIHRRHPELRVVYLSAIVAIGMAVGGLVFIYETSVTKAISFAMGIRTESSFRRNIRPGDVPTIFKEYLKYSGMRCDNTGQCWDPAFQP